MELKESLKKLTESLQASHELCQYISDLSDSGQSSTIYVEDVLETLKAKLTSLSVDELVNQDRLFFSFEENRTLKVVNTNWLKFEKIIEIVAECFNAQPEKKELDVTEVYMAGKAVPEVTAGKADALPPEFIPEPQPIVDFPYDPDAETIVVGDNMNNWDDYKV